MNIALGMLPRRFLLLLPLVVAPLLAAQPYEFVFSNMPGANVSFYGATDSFVFTPDAGTFDFQITASDFGDLDGLEGRIEGTFVIGAITPQIGFPMYESAQVTGLGSFSITDGLGHSLTAALQWVDIFSLDLGLSFGGLNTAGTVNLTNFTGYAGANPRLLQLAGADGEVSLSFQFNPGKSLTELVTQSFNETSYSGSVTVLTPVPEPASWGMIGVAFLLLCVFVVRSGPGQSVKGSCY